MGVFASVNGLVTPGDEARVSVFDDGFLFGDGVYETLRTYGGRLLHLDRHLLRLRASAARLGIGVPLDDETWRHRAEDLLRQAGNAESYLRIVLSRGVGDASYGRERPSGPTVVLIVKPLDPWPVACHADGVDVAVVSTRRNHRDCLDPAIKSSSLLNSVLAIREARARGAFEAVLLNLAGEVAEGSSSNLFLARGGGLRTPPLSAGILPGVTRGLVLEIARSLGLAAEEGTLRAVDLLAADEVFITSTLKEVMPVRSVDGRPVGNGRPGPLTLRLLGAYRTYAVRACGLA